MKERKKEKRNKKASASFNLYKYAKRKKADRSKSRKSIYDFNIHNEGETVESNPKLRSLREFHINGEKKYFEKHIIRSSGHRIHFREEGSNIYIGYIGKHLKTKKY